MTSWLTRRALALGTLTAPLIGHRARAQAGVLRISKQYGLPYLPMMVIEEQRLLETELARRGLAGTKVEWSSVAGPAQQVDGLLSGQYDVIGPGVPTLLTLWDKTVGTPLETRALCAMQSMPYVLITLDRRSAASPMSARPTGSYSRA